jgi:hypothetical protein
MDSVPARLEQKTQLQFPSTGPHQALAMLGNAIGMKGGSVWDAIEMRICR